MIIIMVTHSMKVVSYETCYVKSISCIIAG